MAYGATLCINRLVFWGTGLHKNNGIIMAYLLGELLAIVFVVLLWWATWNSAKKRKIGLTITSYLALFLTPIIAWPVTLFTKKIKKTKEVPTYRQRLKYENTTAMLIVAILYIVLGLLVVVVIMMGYANGINGLVALILFTWGISLFSERNELTRARKEISVDEPEEKELKLDGVNLKPFFVFESNVQRRIDADGSNTTAHTPRKIIVDSDGCDRYKVAILDSENLEIKMNHTLMHKVAYSNIDDCLSMVSDENNEEYTLNVFYKDGQVDKCVIYRKSKNINIHYNKE